METNMTEVITSVVTALSPSAAPIVVCVLGCAFIYFKIQSQRKVTKSERDSSQESIELRLTLVEHDVNSLKQQHQLFSSKLDRILEELTAIKVELAKKAERG